MHDQNCVFIKSSKQWYTSPIDRLKEIVQVVKKTFIYEFGVLLTSSAIKLIAKTTDRILLLLIEDLSVNRAKILEENFDRNE
jgi:hypothetical protein